MRWHLCGSALVHPPPFAAAFPPPDQPILFQPLFIWRSGPPTHRHRFLRPGAGWESGRGHQCPLLDLHGPALLEARWLDLRTQTPVATFKLSWGPPGHGGTDTPASDLRSDYLLLPVQDRVPANQVLDLDPQAPARGARARLVPQQR